MSEKWTPFNINRYVRVKLTDSGRRAHREQHEAFIASSPDSEKARELMPYHPPTEDADGWSRWQLWVLMSELGGECHIGGGGPFETEIEFESAPSSPAARKEN